MFTGFASHLDSLELLLDRLYEAGLRLKPKKCDLFSTKVKFLGYLFTERGIRADPDKTKLIEDWPTPICTRDVRKYLGLISYYRKFVPTFSENASALTQLLKCKLVKRDRSKMFVPVPFKWEHPQQKAFDELKHSLLKNVCFVHPDYSEPFVLEIDASRSALGAVPSQKTNKGKLRPVAFASRKTNKAESNYPAHRLDF